jgi:pimeloyl-ACP methyl ester carboxylesterase
VVNGEFDRAARAGERQFLALAQRAELVVLPGAKHACNLDRPEAFNAAVDAFARRLEG